MENVRFRYDGISIGVTNMLTTLELDEYNTIEVFIPHIGG